MPKMKLGRVSLSPKGTWDENERYERLDVVEYDGSSFIALHDVSGVVPKNDGINYCFLSQRGNAFRYADFTPEQLAALKGEAGEGMTEDDKIRLTYVCEEVVNLRRQMDGRWNPAPDFKQRVIITGEVFDENKIPFPMDDSSGFDIFLT